MSQNHRTEQPPAVVMGAREQPEQMLEIPVEYAAHPRKPVNEEESLFFESPTLERKQT